MVHVCSNGIRPVGEKLDHIHSNAVETKKAVDQLSTTYHFEQIKNWLGPPDPSTNANYARTLRHDSTGAWLLQNPAFQEWISGSRKGIWLHGLAGCGKTVLSTTVLDHLSVNKASDCPLLSFFFDFSDSTKQTVEGMLRSLIFQLYHTPAASTAQLDSVFDAHRKGKDQPNFKTLSDVCFRMMECHERIYVVLDALDESKERSELLLWLRDWASRADLNHVQLFYASRPEEAFTTEFPLTIGRESCLPVDKDAVNVDIRSYVRAQLNQRSEFLSKGLPADLLEHIQVKVGSGADGMWVSVGILSVGHTGAMSPPACLGNCPRVFAARS
jgi:hypothetical protein